MLRAPFIPNAEIRAADARRRDGLPYGLVAPARCRVPCRLCRVKALAPVGRSGDIRAARAAARRAAVTPSG